MGGEQQTRVKAIRCREYTPGFIKVMQRIRNYEAANSTFRFRIISEASMPKAKTNAKTKTKGTKLTATKTVSRKPRKPVSRSVIRKKH